MPAPEGRNPYRLEPYRFDRPRMAQRGMDIPPMGIISGGGSVAGADFSDRAPAELSFATSGEGLALSHIDELMRREYSAGMREGERRGEAQGRAAIAPQAFDEGYDSGRLDHHRAVDELLAVRAHALHERLAMIAGSNPRKLTKHDLLGDVGECALELEALIRAFNDAARPPAPA